MRNDGLKLVKDTPGITTQKLYKALQVDGRSFRPILVAGEQNGFISIEDGKLHLDTWEMLGVTFLIKPEVQLKVLI